MHRWPRVKELFHAALEQPPEARARFLTGAASFDADGETLRAEVERLLAAHGESKDFIEHSPVVPAHSRYQGRQIGRYRVERLIGSGGMGEVYAAHDVELGREVALKIGSDRDLESQARLRREAQHASRLNHPNICTIHEVGAFEGQSYIVMEYVAGERLSDVIPGQGLEIDALVRYGVQIADGLAYAHEHGVSHRDLKTENIVLAADGRAKILDFGLAERLEPGDLKAFSESHAVSDAGSPEHAIAGTLSTMAPELLRGEQDGERGDIWALGIVLYEMAAGTRPFKGTTGFELSGEILHKPVPSLPTRVPTALQAIIRRCLAKHPRERYQHAGEVRAALETVRAGMPVEEDATPRPSRVKSRPRLAAIVAIAVVALGVAAAAIVWQRSRSGGSLALGAAGRPAIAVMRFENMAGSEDVVWMSRGVPNMLLTGLAQIRGLDLVSGQRLDEVIRQTGETSLESLDRSQIAEVARRAGAGAIVVGSIVKAGPDIRIDAQLEDLSTGRVLAAESVRGTDLFALVDELAVRIRDGIGLRDEGTFRHIAEVSTSSLEAYRYYSEGVVAVANVRRDDARGLFEKAVAIDPGFAQAYVHLALIASDQGRTAESERYAAKASEHADRLSERAQLLLKAERAQASGDSEGAMRLVEEAIAKYPDAEDAYILACRLYYPVTGPLHDGQKFLAVTRAGVDAIPSSTLLRNSYGYALLSVGNYPDAVRAFETYAAMAPREPNPHDSLGEAHLQMGMPERAIEQFDRALTIHPSFFPSHVGRAWALGMLGRYDEAIAERQVFGFLRGFMLARVGRYREAEQAIADDIQRAETNQNADEQGLLRLASAVLALERKQAATAAEHVNRAEQIFSRVPAPRRKTLMVLANTLGGLSALQAGSRDRARAKLNAAQTLCEPEVDPERWWCSLLDAEIALSGGQTEKAAAAFSAGEPAGKMWLQLSAALMSLLANNLQARDWQARLASARGDTAGAIRLYHGLLTTGPEQKWTAMYEPRYVLEIARLLEKSGDRTGAAREYGRFLELWKNADPDLPELAEARRAIR